MTISDLGLVDFRYVTAMYECPFAFIKNVQPIRIDKLRGKKNAHRQIGT